MSLQKCADWCERLSWSLLYLYLYCTTSGGEKSWPIPKLHRAQIDKFIISLGSEVVEHIPHFPHFPHSCC